MSEADDLLGFDLPEGAGEFDEGAGSTGPKGKRPNRSVDIDGMIGPGSLQAWMNKTRPMTDLDMIDQAMVEKTYPAAIWYFRQAAVTGDLKATKALEAWITWAKAILAKPKRVQAPAPSTGSTAFAPRGPRQDEIEQPKTEDDEE